MMQETCQQSERVSVDVCAFGGMPDGGGETRGEVSKGRTLAHDHRRTGGHHYVSPNQQGIP